jgi:hypothetical protein
MNSIVEKLLKSAAHRSKEAAKAAALNEAAMEPWLN